MRYFFILGQSPKLSLLEIYTVLNAQGVDFTIEKFSPEVALIDSAAKLDAESLLDSLGGTIKIGKIFKSVKRLTLTARLVADWLASQKLRETKFHFGFSTYRLNDPPFTLHHRFGLEVKKILQQKNISARLVVSREPNLSSVTVAKNRLLKHGAEICLIVDGNTIHLGQTQSVQKFGQYSKFDYDRPGRDSASGMLPPKLAKMMINLSTVSPLSKGGLRGVLLDPFCGSGTILMQAALLGYQNAIGSDLSPKAMADTKQNLAFLTKSLPQLSTLNYQLSTLDATKLSTTHKPNSIDAIVTEPFLGPPLRGSEPTEAIKKIISELSTLYLRAFAEFKKILKPDGRVVIIFPILKSWPSISDQQLEQIKTLGLAPAWNVPELLRPLLTKRHSVIYSRPGQRIEREIFVFKKIK